MHIHFVPFDELDTLTLYALARLRIDVFVVEQACAYPELDGQDTDDSTMHVLGKLGESLAAYARILKLSGQACKEPVANTGPLYIGRVLVHPQYRGLGYARLLMQDTLAFVRNHEPQRPVKLSAQVKVQGFYRSLGFQSVSSIYSEDGIDHIDMQMNQC